MRTFPQIFKAWRKEQKERLPYVSRERFDRKVLVLEKTERELRELANVLINPFVALAAKVRIDQVVPIIPAEPEELCLFLTYAPDPALKQHVVDHVQSLIEDKIAVILIFNTDHPAAEIVLPAAFSSRLSGLLVRQNVGFDFAAWAQVFCMLPRGMPKRRLYFINDSIVGPLDQAAYRTVLERIRASNADMIGLTQNRKPAPHLQSFFLAFSERLFKSPTFASIMSNALNLPSKSAVINVYEIQLTEYLQARGFRAEALFPSMALSGHSNDTIFRWAQLIEAGFPFIKASVLRDAAGSADLVRLVPGKYR